jgi:hypothetical protein
MRVPSETRRFPNRRHGGATSARFVAACVLGVALGLAPAAAEEHLGPFAEVLGEGPLGRGFEGRLDGNGYLVVNDGRADAWLHRLPAGGIGEPGQRDLAVTLSLDEAGEAAGAGIVYAFDRQSGAFLAFVLEPGDVVALYERTPLGLELRHRGGMEAGPSEERVLRVVEDGGQLTVLLDGRTAYAFEGWLVGSGEIGLLVKGTGWFRFRTIEGGG